MNRSLFSQDPPKGFAALFALLGSLTVATLVGAAPAGAASWRSVGPGGGALDPPPLAAPSDRHQAFVLARFHHGLFRTADGGVTWRRVETPTLNLPFALLAIDPREPNTLFALFRSLRTRLVVSHDAGLHWRAASAGLPFTGDGSSEIHGVAFDPAVAGRAFAATEHGIYETRDGGASWSLFDFGESQVLAIAAPRANELWAAIAFSSGTHGLTYDVEKSRNGGASWAGTAWPFQRRLDGAAFRFDPRDAERVYLIANQELFARDAANVWARRNPGGSVSDLVVLDRGELFATTAAGNRESADGGRTWTGSGGRPALSALAVTGPREILATGENGAWRSTDGGDHFQAASQGLHAQIVSALAVAADGEVWAGIQGPTLMRTRDRGGDWTREVRGLGISPFGELPVPLDLAASSTQADPLYVVLLQPTQGAVRLAGSLDGGSSWTYRSVPPTTDPSTNFIRLAVDPRDSERLYWTATSSADPSASSIWRSDDGGRSWGRPFSFASNEVLLDLAIDPAEPNTLLAMVTNGLWRSRDGGVRWRHTGQGLPSLALPYGFGLAIDPERPRDVYVAVADGVFKSRDGGATFRRLGPALPLTARRGLAVAAGGRLLVASAERGVDQWHPESGTYESVGPGLPLDLLDPRLQVDPSDRRTIYAATSGRSVWRLDLEP